MKSDSRLSIKGEILDGVKVAKFTSWKVGGECKCMLFPKDLEDLLIIMDYVKHNNIEYQVMGNGSNILKSDDYYEGYIINLSKGFNQLRINGNKIYVGAGYQLPKLAFDLARHGIGGFDFYVGIPGTVGGAVVMNAGSAGSETKEVLEAVTYLDENNEVVSRNIKDIKMDFRFSEFQNGKNIILEVEFNNKHASEKEEVLEFTKKMAKRRRDKFPLNIPTAGSTFKSPKNGPYPGKVVEEIGLKGLTYGGAKISEKHGNWIENTGSASAKDIHYLIKHIQNEAKNLKDIDLEIEVVYFP